MQPTEPSSPDAMDVDNSFIHIPSEVNDAYLSSPAPSPAPGPPSGKGFNNLFFESNSPVRALDDSPAYVGKKRRSAISPDVPVGRRRAGSIGALESSPAAEPSSPIEMKLERNMNASQTLIQRLAKPMLSGLGGASHTVGVKRPRRPAISTLELSNDEEHDAPISAPVPLPRRAFSAMLPTGLNLEAMDDGDSSFESNGDMSSPAAAYKQRQQTRTIRRRDGTEDFRPLTAVDNMAKANLEVSPRSMPQWGGFGDNEASGKILPCHRVREDGLMRIKSSTVSAPSRFLGQMVGLY